VSTLGDSLQRDGINETRHSTLNANIRRSASTVWSQSPYCNSCTIGKQLWVALDALHYKKTYKVKAMSLLVVLCITLREHRWVEQNGDFTCFKKIKSSSSCCKYVLTIRTFIYKHECEFRFKILITPPPNWKHHENPKEKITDNSLFRVYIT